MTRLQKKRGVYYARIRTPKGKTRYISTRCSDLKSAKQVARQAGIKELDLAAKAGRLTQEVVGRLTTGKKITLAKALAPFRQWLAGRRAPRTTELYSEFIERWINTLAIQNLPPLMVADDHISAWVNNDDPGLKASSRATMLSALRVFMDFCAAKGWRSGNPAALVDVQYHRLSHAQKEPRKRIAITEHQYTRLCQHTQSDPASQFWHFAIVAAWEHGWRLGDICSLEWTAFTPDHQAIIWTDKHDQRLPAVRLSQRLQMMAAAVPRVSPRFLWPEQQRIYTHPKRRAGLSVQFRRIAAACGIENKSFHCLRHACAQRLKAQGRETTDISRQLGHASSKTTEIYLG